MIQNHNKQVRKNKRQRLEKLTIGAATVLAGTALASQSTNVKADTVNTTGSTTSHSMTGFALMLKVNFGEMAF